MFWLRMSDLPSQKLFPAQHLKATPFAVMDFIPMETTPQNIFFSPVRREQLWVAIVRLIQKFMTTIARFGQSKPLSQRVSHFKNLFPTYFLNHLSRKFILTASRILPKLPK